MTPDDIHDLAQMIVNKQGTYKEMMEYAEAKISRAIAAAVYAEHQRTLEQCANVVEKMSNQQVPQSRGSYDFVTCRDASASIRALP